MYVNLFQRGVLLHKTFVNSEAKHAHFLPSFGESRMWIVSIPVAKDEHEW